MRPEPRFRAALPSDYAAIAAIWNESWKSTGVESPEQLSDADLKARLVTLVDQGARLIAVEQAGELAGLILLKPAETCLSQLFLTPQWQGNGLGQSCLQFVRREFPDGFWLTVAEANDGAVRFYKRNGLTRESRVWRDDYQRFDLRFAWSPNG
ncbi:MAG: GNAT family N-acetyltransferase [Hyphomonadaceae bacterium]|nr:GNAT family N-acetyltransferase [Hyphomonadaceae bacterium]